MADKNDRPDEVFDHSPELYNQEDADSWYEFTGLEGFGDIDKESWEDEWRAWIKRHPVKKV